jgi:hypothetical protein
MVRVSVNRLERRQLENLVLSYQGFAKDLLDIVMHDAKPEWKVYRRVKERADLFQGKRLEPYREIYHERHVIEERAERNERYWDDVRDTFEVDPPVPPSAPTGP